MNPADPAVAAGCTLPVDVSKRVGRAQTFAYRIPDLTVLKGTRDYVWEGYTKRGQIPPGIFSSFYITADRSPYLGPNAGHDLAWYQRHHPNWIVYRPDTKTPAWEFCAAMDMSCNPFVPLAIWRADVQAHMEEGDVNFAVRLGNFQGISADNVSVTNTFVRSGTCSVIPDNVGCVHAGGVWNQRYETADSHTSRPVPVGSRSIPVENAIGFAKGMQIYLPHGGAKNMPFNATISGQPVDDVVPVSVPTETTIAAGADVQAYLLPDQQLARDWENWLDELKRYLHAVGLCLSANVSWHAYNRSDWLRVAVIPDIVYDEQGFGGSNTMICKQGGGNAFHFYDATWIAKASDFAKLANGFVLEGAACDVVKEAWPEIQYNLASYLLVKNAHSYQTMMYTSGLGFGSSFEDYSPDMYLIHGNALGPMQVNSDGIYYRRFEQALALLNPSSSTAAVYDLGGAVYHASSGQRYTGVIRLAPTSGLVLVAGEPADGTNGSPINKP